MVGFDQENQFDIVTKHHGLIFYLKHGLFLPKIMFAGTM